MSTKADFSVSFLMTAGRMIFYEPSGKSGVTAQAFDHGK